jgi:anaphase-promoting complex subunit 2
VELNIEDVPLNRRKKDIIRSLIDIYGSKDVFIKEYQLILTDRLLGIINYNIEQEVRKYHHDHHRAFY